MVDHPIYRPGRLGKLPSKLPCVECPLRRDSKPGALGGYTVMQYLEILTIGADIACHLSPGFPKDRAEQRSCTGVAMYRANTGVRVSGHAQEAVAHVGPDREAAFASPVEFANHHRKD